MKKHPVLLIFVILTIIGLVSCENMPTNTTTNPISTMKKRLKPGTVIPVSYPNTTQDSTVRDKYFGEIVADPFRWLEDDNAPATKAWVKAQNKETFSYLDKIPYRDAIANRLEELWNFEKFGTPFEESGKYYYFYNSGLQNQATLFQEGENGTAPKLILDPNKFSTKGTSSLGALSFSNVGKYLAYAVSEGGSDWRTIKVQDLTTGETLSDKVEWVKFSGISWFKDGFFYSRYPTPKKGDELKSSNIFHKMYYHKIGTPQSQDELVFSDRSNPKINVSGRVTEDEKYLVISPSETTSNNKLYFKNVEKGETSFTPIVEDLTADFWAIGNDGDRLFVITNDKAPNYKLIAINTAKPERDYWEEIIAEDENVLQSVSMAGGKLVAKYIEDASSKLKVYDYEGHFKNDIALPSVGSVGGFSGKKDKDIAFYDFTSFNAPSTIFKYDFKTNTSTVYKRPNVKGFNADLYETKQVFYTSKDGTKVPMSITYKKGTKLDGTNPTLLYGYGGFNISVMPRFNVYPTILLENGGIYAVANIRGGGEYGKKWHDGGRLKNKQNVFDDFIAAAEYLIDNKYTSKEKIAIEGRSNGGLLVGACMTQRPDLFKVALPGVGVLDMLRYHNFTIGRAWATDYGLSSDSIQFRYLINYSPLHNVQAGTEYPATLVTTADHDDRVVPAHSFKFISELQRKHEGKNPVLIRIDTSAGHGAGKPTKMQIAEMADKLAFILFNTASDVIYEY